MKYLSHYIFGIGIVISLFFVAGYRPMPVLASDPNIAREKVFDVQSIDTMKESRDKARSVLGDLSYDKKIDIQMQAVKDLGATHVAVATPYDEEFVPVLTRWVLSARRHGLSVWFRGNFSGWEGWFSYSKISSSEHTTKTKNFILNHPNLFADGDIFSPCPECENGGSGDPRTTGKVDEYRQFLIKERQTSLSAFSSIGKNVTTSYPSMNADVARLVMNKSTTATLGGVVVIDHYVKSPDQFKKDVGDIASASGGSVALGEFGAPIPDLQGNLTDAQQAAYVEKLMGALYSQQDHVPLVNYWDLSGGSTALLNDNGTRRQAYYVVQRYFTAPYVSGEVINPLGDKLSGVSVHVVDGPNTYDTMTNEDGKFRVFLPYDNAQVTVGGGNYSKQELVLHQSEKGTVKTVTLTQSNPSVMYILRSYVANLIPFQQMVNMLASLRK